MLHKSWGRVPAGIRNRPFDIFVALFLSGLGIYQILDPDFPEMQQTVFGNFILTLISLYMIAAGIVIVWCIIHKCKNIIMNMYAEMYAWLFMWAAVFGITLFDLYIGFSQPISNYALYYSILWFWILLSVATFIRWVDLNQVLRKIDA